jgi:hypothetical protein
MSAEAAGTGDLHSYLAGKRWDLISRWSSRFTADEYLRGARQAYLSTCAHIRALRLRIPRRVLP